MILSVLVGIWAEPRYNRHADLCLFTLGGRQMVRSCEVGFKTQKGVSGDGQQTTEWKLTDFKLKEYQAAKIHRSETTVETGKSIFLVTSLQSRRATLAGPCCPWDAFQNRKEYNNLDRDVSHIPAGFQPVQHGFCFRGTYRFC